MPKALQKQSSRLKLKLLSKMSSKLRSKLSSIIPSKTSFALLARGIAMGTADIIPGISGGTIAFITGIYPRLVYNIEAVKFNHLFALIKLISSFLFFNKNRKRKESRKKSLSKLKDIDWLFLLPILCGMLIAIITMVNIIPFLLKHYEFQIYSFLMGVIAVSIIFPFRLMRKGLLEYMIILFGSIIFFYLLGFQEGHSQENSHPIFILLSGALAICAMLLPGVSGSYVILMLGQYELLIQSIRELNLFILLFFSTGMLIGLFSFVKLLRFILERYHSWTMALLIAMMIASLRGIWPPSLKKLNKYNIANELNSLLVALCFIILGAVLILIFDYLHNKNRPSKS